MQQAPPPQAPAELAARPAPSGGSRLDYPGPADAYRDLRALPGLSDLWFPTQPELPAQVRWQLPHEEGPLRSAWRPTGPEELMAARPLGDKLLGGDLKARLFKP